MILGIDEVGRGPWAGPLVVGAVVLGGEQIEGLTDSKKLSKKRREELAEEIYQKAQGLGLGWVHAHEIDKIGLSESLVLATIRAVSQVNCLYSEIIIDGTVNFLKDTGKGQYVTTMKKADLLVPSVSAASIVAKVARDIYMDEQDASYPEYGFKSHVGYGTAKHRAAIDEHGVTPLHRLSFAPLAKYKDLSTANSQNGFAPGSIRAPASDRTRAADILKNQQSTTKQIGDRAEEVVAEYLRKNGQEILERNWKTKFCEIDIVSRKGDTIYFTEVKYRKNVNQGGGIAAITPKKLRQMKFAAEYFVLKYQLNNTSLCLAAAHVLGEDFELQEWLGVE
ncbi:MAG TPA: ribonuclease HII [Candidatus Saccharimonadales bacterium]